MIRSRTHERSKNRLWYKSASYLLNNVAPTLIHDYANQRYWNSASGSTSFPFTSTRTTNATMFDRNGNLVWAPANMIPQSSTAGAVVGVVGSGGAVPTGWAWSTATGITREVIAVTSNYIDVKFSGTNATGALVYPQITALNTPVSASASEGFCGSMYVQIIDNTNVSGLAASGLKINTQYLNSGAYVNEAPPSPQATTTEQRLISKGNAPASGINQVRVSLNLTIIIGGSIDITLRIGRPQLEKLDITSPKDYIETTGTAIYKHRIDYDPNTLDVRGLLIEESRTNLSPIYGEFGQSGYVYGGIPNPTIGVVRMGRTFHRMTGDGTLSPHYCSGGSVASTPPALTVYTSSAYVHYNPAQPYIQVTASGNFASANTFANFDLSTGTVGTVGIDVTKTDIIPCGNGVYRLAITYATNAAPISGGAGCIVALITALTDTRLPNNTLSTYTDAFGYQMELGSIMTSLIPTFGVSATRAADTLTGSIGSWITQGLGVLFVEYIETKLPSGVFPTLVQIDDGTASNIAQVFSGTNATGSTGGARVDTGGAVQVNGTTSNYTNFGTVTKVAMAYTTNNTRLVTQGGTISLDITCTIGTTMSTLRIGKNTGSVVNARWIKSIRYYGDVSASDGQLQALTT